MKICSKCGDEKSIDEFSKAKSYKDGFRGWCKKCQSGYGKKWRKNNLEKVKENNRKWRENNFNYRKECSKRWRKNNPNYIKEYSKKWQKANPNYQKEYNKKYWAKNKDKFREEKRIYYQNNKEKIDNKNKKWRKDNIDYARKYSREWQKKRLENNLIYKLNARMSNAIWKSLKDGKNGKHWEILVGYTLNNLVEHLENLFLPNMNWNNYGRGKDKWNIDHIRPISIFNITSAKCKGFKKCWALENLRPMWASENISKKNKLFY